MAGLAGRLDLVHRRFQLRRVQRLRAGHIDQFAGHAFQLPGQLMEARLALPHFGTGTAVTAIAYLREVLPRLVRKVVQLQRTAGKLHPVERQPATQHAAQVFAGLEHVLEDDLALAQRRVGVNPLATTQGCTQGHCCQHYNGQSLQHDAHFGLRKGAASIAAPQPNTNSHIKNRGESSCSPTTGMHT